MADFTTLSRRKLNWEAPPQVEQSGQAFDLLIADGFYLDIGDGFHLTAQSATTDVEWTHTGRSKIKWPAPVVTLDDFYLDIGDGFNLLINDTNKLVVNPAKPEVVWTNISRKQIKF